MSHIMRKPDFCLCKKKGADELCSNCTADQRLCFLYTDSKISSSSSIQNFKLLAIFCNCTDRFVSDLVGNPLDHFSHVAAHIEVDLYVFVSIPLMLTSIGLTLAACISTKMSLVFCILGIRQDVDNVNSSFPVTKADPFFFIQFYVPFKIISAHMSQASQSEGLVW